MIHLEHQRREGHLSAWKQIGLHQTLGPALSPARRLWLQTGRKVWVAISAAEWFVVSPLPLVGRKRSA